MTTPIPTGRYSITVTGRPTLVKLTRVTTHVWLEAHHQELRAEILHELRTVDLETASALYTARTGICGVCGRIAVTDHNGCLARKFDRDASRDWIPIP